LTPYDTLGYARTHVLAWGAMQVELVHGGALVRFPCMAKAPEDVTDILTEPGAAALPPRFHPSPASCMYPMLGPVASQPPGRLGPKGQLAVHSHVLPCATVAGMREIFDCVLLPVPQAGRAAAKVSASSTLARDRVLERPPGRRAS
jgi:hypothetical protein